MDRIKISNQQKENQERRQDNLRLFSGLLRGVYYLFGIKQPRKETRIKRGWKIKGTIRPEDTNQTK